MKLKTTVRSELRAGELHDAKKPADEKASSSAYGKFSLPRVFSYLVKSLIPRTSFLPFSFQIAFSFSLALAHMRGRIGMKTLNSPTSRRNARFRRTAYRHQPTLHPPRGWAGGDALLSHCQSSPFRWGCVRKELRKFLR